MDDAPRWIEEKSATTFHPSQVSATLRQLVEVWPDSTPPLADLVTGFPLGEAALLRLFAASSISAARTIRDPAILVWLAQPEICAAPRSYGEMSDALRGLAGDAVASDNFRALRRWRGREMTRIALREVADVALLEETTAELSQLAEICIRRVYEHCDAEMRAGFGAPQAQFAMIALGKLGGRELNHSSDVDLLLVYSEEGQLASGRSHQEFYHELAERIVEIFSSADREGRLLRIDLRLRPEGSAGPLIRSLESMEHYYGGFGESWERLALVKARHVAGSRELSYEFLRQLQPFIYPKSATPNLLDEIASIKRRIERDVVGQAQLGRNVKLGRGGIREIEFIVQTLQLIHGAGQTFLQEPNTLNALRGLARLELMPRSEVLQLDKAYRFLRRTEHRLQIEAEEQTHTVPSDPERLRRLALSLNFSSAADFAAALETEMIAVRALFDKMIGAAPRSNEFAAVDLSIFSDRAAAERAMADLVHGSGSAHTSTRRRQAARRLQPLLTSELAKTADPNAALTQLVRFVEAHGMRSLLFDLLVSNPNLLRLLVKSLDASRVTSDLLVRRPQLLEEITRDPQFDRPLNVAAHLKSLHEKSPQDRTANTLRTYRQRQLLRILFRDIAGASDLATVHAEQTALAEATVIYLRELVGADELTIIAMGKFGGSEISYAADLDVLFAGDDERSAQRLLGAFAQPSAEGALPRVDARLRPEGEKGPLVCSLPTYRRYYAERAQLWELQALTRARAVVGPLQAGFIAIAAHAWRAGGKDADLFAKIDNMLERIRRERGSGSEHLDFKTGVGGMIEAEFLVQALQMRSGTWEPNWSRAVDQLAVHGDFTGDEAADLKRSYDFLRQCESVLRRYEDKPVAALPAGELEQQNFIRRLGFSNPETFVRTYHHARRFIHEVYERKVRRG